MSNKLLNAVWSYNAKNSGQKVVLLCLADHANDAGQCWPGVDRIAAMTGLKERMVQNHLTTLQSDGVISIEYNQGMKTVSGWTNRYTILLKGCSTVHPSDSEGVQCSTPLGEGVQYSAPDGVQCSTPQGVQHSAPKPPVNPQLNPHNNNSGSANKKQQTAAAFAAIVSNYEDFISVNYSSVLADEFNEYAEQVQPIWVANAFKAAESQNVRKWSYVRAILDSCIAAGGWVDKRNGNGTNGNRQAAAVVSDPQKPTPGKFKPVENFTL